MYINIIDFYIFKFINHYTLYIGCKLIIDYFNYSYKFTEYLYYYK